MSKGIYGYYDKENDYILVYPGKDSNIHKNQRHKNHLSPSRYDKQVINRVLQNNPDRYEYRVICEYPDLTDDELNWLECMEIMKHKFLYGETPKFNFTVGGDGISGYKKPYEDFKYTVSKKGFHNGKQQYTVCDRNNKPIKTSIDKNFIADLVEKLNNGEITEKEARIIDTFKYTVSKMGFDNGKQKYGIFDGNNNPIKTSIDKNFIAYLVEKLNNGEITEEKARIIDTFKYTVSKMGFHNGKQKYSVCDRNHNPIKTSIDKKFIADLVEKLNNAEITEEEAKKIRR